jgi:tetraacyldisaccharide 4'-kinase
MISSSSYRELVSGRWRGVAATMLRAGLRIASVPYGWAIGARNRRFDRGVAATHRAPVPVVSIGNLTVGGTGKTPMVEWLARRLREREVRVAILSRGYGAAADGRNDEALELELALPDVPHLQNPDRAASAAIAVEELASQLLVLDDGFQHRQLARDCDIVLLDASEPFGFERVLPAGTLREPVDGLRRASVVVLSRADILDEAARYAIRRRVAQINPDAVWCEASHRAKRLLASDNRTEPLAALGAHERVAAFCGIGNPAGFRHTIAAVGCRAVAWREFPDHHAYTRGDVEALDAWAAAARASLVLCTRKDLVKLRVPTIGGAALRALSVDLEFLAGRDALEAALEPLILRALSVEFAD